MGGLSNVQGVARDDPALAFAISEIKRLYGHTVYPRKSLHKYGRVTGFGTSETLISSVFAVNGGIVFANNDILFKTSDIFTSVVSDGADTGTLTIEGHTYSGGVLTFVSRAVTLTGTTPVTLDTPLRDVTRMAYESGTVTANVGNIYAYYGTASSGVPSTAANIANVIRLGEGQTLHCATSFSSQDYFVVTGVRCGLSKSSGANAAATFRARVKTSTGSWRTQWTIDTVREAGPHMELFKPYYIVQPNSDVAITAEGSTTSLSATAVFDGYICTISE